MARYGGRFLCSGHRRSNDHGGMKRGKDDGAQMSSGNLIREKEEKMGFGCSDLTQS